MLYSNNIASFHFYFICHSLVLPARKSAASTYFPIVAALNIGYLFLRVIYQFSSVSASHVAITIALVGLSCISYKGILEDHANTIPGKGSSDALAGGASLDLLGLVTVVQYGSVFVSCKFYWLLIVIPVWGIWKLYSLFYGSKGSGGGFMPNSQRMGGSNDDAVDPAAAEKANAKRQKRAERRRQKWS